MSNRIEDEIVGLIEAGALRPGDRLPSERDLADLLGVSRPSVRAAVNRLAARGRLQVRRGHGVFVSASG